MGRNILFVHSGGFWKDSTFKKAHDLGYGVVLAQKGYTGTNPFIESVLDIDVFDPEAAARQISGDLQDIHGVTTFFELAVEATALIAERAGLRGNPPEAAQRSRDKFKMRECFKAAGIPSVAAFSLVTSSDDIAAFGAAHGYPIILKPTKFGAAAGVVRINSDADAHRLFDFVAKEIESFCEAYRFPASEVALMVETMIDPEATEANVDMIVHDGEPLVVSIAEKPQDTTGPTFQENDYVMPPASLAKADVDTLARVAASAVRGLWLRWGAAHLEAKVIRKAGACRCYVVEVGARCGGDLEVPAVKASTGIDLAEIVIRQAMGDFNDADFAKLRDELQRTEKRPVAVQVIYAPRNGVIKEILVPDVIRNDPRCLAMRFEYKPGDEILMHYSDYVGAIMVAEATPAQALALVNDLVFRITIEMA